MNTNYKAALDLLVKKKMKEIPTSFSESALTSIFETLTFTPQYLSALAKQYDDNSSLLPIIENKRSFRETLTHLLNFEGLNYITIYPAWLLNQPQVYPIHSERDFNRLSLFSDFTLEELLNTYCYERKKYLNFLKKLKTTDWHKQIIEEGKARQESIYLMARRTAVHDYTHVQILQFQTNFFLKA